MLPTWEIKGRTGCKSAQFNILTCVGDFDGFQREREILTLTDECPGSWVMRNRTRFLSSKIHYNETFLLAILTRQLSIFKRFLKGPSWQGLDLLMLLHILSVCCLLQKSTSCQRLICNILHCASWRPLTLALLYSIPWLGILRSVAGMPGTDVLQHGIICLGKCDMKSLSGKKKM